MTYTEARAYVYGLINYEKEPHLSRFNPRKFSRVRDFFRALGDPQRPLAAIHVAGTKGKGSTCIYLAHALASLGYTVGLYMSPHVSTIRERIALVQKDRDRGTVRVKMISKALFSECASVVMRKDLLLRNQGIACTFFEALTAMAFIYFQKSRVDWAVIETGLGGRFDATNVVDPRCVVLTKIDYDHCRQLGNHIEDIAYQKAGIIKKRVPVISDSQKGPALRVFRRIARKQRADLAVLGRDFKTRITSDQKGRVCFDFLSGKQALKNIVLPTFNRHQAHNAALALQALWTVVPRQSEFLPAIRKALRQACIPARAQIITRRPLVMVDVAHNPVSIQAMCTMLRRHFPGKKVAMVFGASKDKDLVKMLHFLRQFPARQYIFTQAAVSRAAQAEELKKMFGENDCLVYDDSSAAFETAKRQCGRNGMIVVCGSFYIVAEAMKYFKKPVSRIA